MNKTFTGIRKINLTTSSGSCRLVKGTTSEVSVTVRHSYASNDYQPAMEQDGSTLYLKEDFAGRGSYSGSSSWELTVPDNIEIRFSSGSGDFEANDMVLKLTGSTGSGDYRWKNVSGESKINTGSGNITIDDFRGTLDLNTGSGDVAVTKASGDLYLNTGSGEISLTQVKGKFSANVGSGNIKGSQLELTGKSTFNSGSGNINVRLATVPDFAIAVNSGSGDAVLDFNGNKIEGKITMVVNKRNGNIVAPFAFDKTEELDEDGYNNVRIRKTAQLGAKDVDIKISSGSGTAEIRK
ncbi:hypothetical protein WSM22_11470 [Cytophagales bacterium WSM2-2]|nr:hypothetical protein WSM22_11470 [Cytophagales bacterium WSM2-2]